MSPQSRTIQGIVHFNTNFKLLSSKEWFDKQHISKRITLDFQKPAWSKFMSSMLNSFGTSANYKQLEFVECVGFQHHTAKNRGGLSKRSANDENLNGIDFNFFRYCYGPELFFTSDGNG